VSKGNDGHSLLICTALLLFVCANEAKAQRLIMPGNGSEQYQRPDVNVRVRIADSTFTNQGQGQPRRMEVLDHLGDSALE